MEICAIKGVWGRRVQSLMANAILNFHFSFWNHSLFCKLIRNMDQTGFPSKFLQTFGLQAVKRISKWGGGLLKLGVTFAFHQVHQTIHLYVFHNSRFLHSKFKINIIRERNRFNTGWSLSMIVQVDHQRPHSKLAVSLEQLVQHLDIDFKHVWIFSHEIFPSMEYGQCVEYFHLNV